MTAYKVEMGAQTVVKPFRTPLSVPYITVKSIHNGTHIAFLIEWKDDTKNDRTVKVDEFRDAVAIMLAPYGVKGILAMGKPGTRVNILHWKADWQADIDKGFRDITSAYPNFWIEVYPYVIGEPPYTMPKDFERTAKVYLPGWQVGNPLSQPLKVTPVEELVAEGFGTLTSQPHQDSIGRGVWQDGVWRVVIARKMQTGDPMDISLAVGGRYSIAFAVWDGETGDVGGRKSVSMLLSIYIST